VNRRAPYLAHEVGSSSRHSHHRQEPDFQLGTDARYREHAGTAGTAAHFVSVMSELGVDVDAITRLARHFSLRTSETIYRHELRTLITTGTDDMDGICIQPGAPVCGV
jgi:hypothetical protein